MKHLFLFTVFVLIFPVFVSAHVLKTDGSIGGVLHIDPEDDPIVGQNAHFFLEVKDKNGQFSWSGCRCVFEVFDQGERIHSQPMTEHGVEYAFSKRGVYTVRISGIQPTFNLEYGLRVSKEMAESTDELSVWQRLVQWFQSLFIRR